ncbi:MAG: 7-carboxy-7-deazaguanine synthase [Planctomycetota bacterium]|nr:7-carboxy-7-deazaguanine synthase QueE [Planctomycetota bacterium]MCX8039137.1 7-carboxy-7-deazaguanine synthase QueE [Planctomycetota bacterium]MDW8372571.1 7-carboxy-7-deazaguanine synthase [Planctomycetota bacterium]
MSTPRRYRVKEIFGPTIQGEGLHAGSPCLFVRLAGCNAWDGRPQTRAASACPYCDTDFLGGEELTLDEILQRLAARRAPASASLGCVLSGGEPLLQADRALLAALGAAFPWVDIESNGTRPCPPRPANVALCCSPKEIAGQPIVVDPDWWKILVPAQERFLERALASGKPVFVQPLCPDEGPQGPAYAAALARCLELCYRHGCRLSLQLHKLIGVP